MIIWQLHRECERCGQGASYGAPAAVPDLRLYEEAKKGWAQCDRQGCGGKIYWCWLELPRPRTM